MVMVAMANACTFLDIPRVFEEKVQELSRQYVLGDEKTEFLLIYVSTLTRRAFEVSSAGESRLEDMHRLQFELLSLDSDGRFEKALSELKGFIWTFLETPNVQWW